ncbi:MAG: hypothetical protein ACK56F_25270, partial [bacterium]
PHKCAKYSSHRVIDTAFLTLQGYAYCINVPAAVAYTGAPTTVPVSTHTTTVCLCNVKPF